MCVPSLDPLQENRPAVPPSTRATRQPSISTTGRRGANGGRPQEDINVQRPQTEHTCTPITTEEDPPQPQCRDSERRRNTAVSSKTRGRRKEEEITGEPGSTTVTRKRDERGEESTGRPRRGVGEGRKEQDADLSRRFVSSLTGEFSACTAPNAPLPSHAPSGLRDITNDLSASRGGQKRVFNLSSAPARSKPSRAKQQPAPKVCLMITAHAHTVPL